MVFADGEEKVGVCVLKCTLLWMRGGVDDRLKRAPRRLRGEFVFSAATEYDVCGCSRHEVDDGVMARGKMVVGGVGGAWRRVE